jgi:hypothetical protein
MCREKHFSLNYTRNVQGQDRLSWLPFGMGAGGRRGDRSEYVQLAREMIDVGATRRGILAPHARRATGSVLQSGNRYHF